MKKIRSLILLMQFLVFPYFISAQTRVVCVGNSITAGYTLSDPGKQSWPAQLGKMLGSKYSVLNCGVSGTTMVKKEKGSYWNTATFTRAKDFDPQILIISLGTNDAAPSNWISKDNFYNDYSAMIDEFRQNGRNPIVYVCYPATCYADQSQINNIQNVIMPLIKKISIDKNATIINFNYPTKDKRNTLYNDNLHPNAAGALVLANEAFRTITPAIPTFYQNCLYDGYAIKLGIGDYNLSALIAKGISNDDISGVKVPAGYKILAYSFDNFEGTPITITNDYDCLGSWDNQITSVKVRADGVTDKSGTYSIQNKKSSKYMDVAENSTANGAQIIQWDVSGANNQKFMFTDTGDGLYKITSVSSGKALDISGVSINNTARLTQWSAGNGLNQRYILLNSENGYYKLKVAHSGRIIEVYNGNINSGEVLNQYDDNNQTHGQWKLASFGSTLKKSATEKENPPVFTGEESKNISIFPNPSSTFFILTNVPANEKIVVIDLNGQIQLRLTSPEKAGDFKIDIGNLRVGTYLVKVGENDTAALKLMKN